MGMARLISAALQASLCVLSLCQIVPETYAGYKASNVLAHYHLDGSDDNISVNGAKFVDGRYTDSKAVYFNRSSTHVSTPVTAINKKNFTIACWIKLASLEGVQTIYADSTNSPNFQFDFGVGKIGQLFFRRKYRNMNRSVFLIGGGKLPVNHWAHVAVTWKQNERRCQLYIDAVEVGNGSFASNGKFHGPQVHSQWIGKRATMDGNQFYGAIMDLYVLDAALSPEELNQLRGFPRMLNPIIPVATLYKNEFLKCRAEGLPTPHVTWLQNGQIVNNGTSLAILKIPKAGEKHKESYKCVASNMVGETSKVVNITVVGPFALCTKYSTIDDVTRSVNHPFQGSAIAEAVDNQKWYRLSGKAGTQLPTRCVPVNRCGAQAPGWLNGKYPDMKDGIVQRKVCFHLNGDCCGYENMMQIRKCFEGFYVYKFESLPSSIPGRYCAAVYQEKEDRGSFPVFVSTPYDTGFALKDHVIYTVREVTNLFHCMSYCSLQDGCVSFNFSPQDQVCELNDATKTSHDGDYKAEKSFVYYENGGRIIDVGDTRYNG